MTSLRHIVLVALLLLPLLPAAAAAQPVSLDADRVEPAVRELQALIARGRYTLIDRDTTLGPDVRIEGDLLIVAAEVRLAGAVQGAVGVIRGSLFIRPGARVGGPVAVLGGEANRSALASEVDILYAPVGTAVTLREEGGGYAVAAMLPSLPRAVRLPGAFGLGLPTYDRVNGLTLRWTTSLLPTRDERGPEVWGSGALRSARRTFDAGVGARVPVAGGVRLAVAAERTTLTNEAPFRGDLGNTLGVLLGSDHRDYYASDRVTAMLERPHRQPLIAGEQSIAPRVGVLASRDRSLRAANVWSVRRPSGGWRPNPEIDDGTIVSVLAGAEYRWRGRGSDARLDLGVEHALPGGSGFEFTQGTGALRFSTETFGEQSLAVDAYGRTTFGDSAAPRQRWTTLGGSATIPTLGAGDRRGDRFAWVHSLYSIPLSFVTLPVIGSPDLQLIHIAGSAWVTGQPAPPWVQNIGVGLGTGWLHARFYLDPEDPRGSLTFSVGLGL